MAIYALQTAPQLKSWKDLDMLTGLSVADYGDHYRVVYEVSSKLWGFLSETKGKEIRRFSSWAGAMSAAASILGDKTWVNLIEPDGPLQEVLFSRRDDYFGEVI